MFRRGVRGIIRWKVDLISSRARIEHEVEYLSDAVPVGFEEADRGRTEAEARDLVKQVLTELQLTSIKEFGRAMKEVQARAKGRADGKLLSEIVRASLD